MSGLSAAALTLDPVIDVHAHWLPESARRACERGADWQGMRMSRSATGLPVAAEHGQTFEVAQSGLHFDGLAARTAAMDNHGVDVQVLSLLPRLYRYERDTAVAVGGCRSTNDELAAEIDAAPAGRFLGLGVLPLQAADDAVEELRRCIEQLGLVGVALGTTIRGSRWEDERLWTVLEAAQALRAIVFVHPSAPSGFELPAAGYRLANVFGNPADTTLALQTLALSGALERFADLKLVAAHGGGYLAMSLGRLEHSYRVRPEAKERATKSPLEALRCVYVDTVVHAPAALRFLVEAFGHDRVLLGTDFPADMALPDPVGFVTGALGSDAPVTRGILGGNLVRLLHAGDPAGRQVALATTSGAPGPG